MSTVIDWACQKVLDYTWNNVCTAFQEGYSALEAFNQAYPGPTCNDLVVTPTNCTLL